MATNNINNILIPNVSKLPGHKSVDNIKDKLRSPEAEEFKKLLQEKVDNVRKEHGIQLSTHAAKRLEERNLNADTEEFMKLKEAMARLRDKGGRESLVITDKAAYILDVNNNRVVTAIDKDKMAENVFTKIDSTLFMN